MHHSPLLSSPWQPAQPPAARPPSGTHLRRLLGGCQDVHQRRVVQQVAAGVGEAEQQVVLQLADALLVRGDLRCRGEVGGRAAARPERWEGAEGQAADSGRRQRSPLRRRTLKLAGPLASRCALGCPGRPPDRRPFRTSASSCARCVSSSAFSLSTRRPSSWSSSPAAVTVKSITVTLAVAGGKAGAGEGRGGGRSGTVSRAVRVSRPAGSWAGEHTQRGRPRLTTNHPHPAPAELLGAPDSSGVKRGLGRRVVQ